MGPAGHARHATCTASGMVGPYLSFSVSGRGIEMHAGMEYYAFFYAVVSVCKRR